MTKVSKLVYIDLSKNLILVNVKDAMYQSKADRVSSTNRNKFKIIR